MIEYLQSIIKENKEILKVLGMVTVGIVFLIWFINSSACH